MEGNIWTLTISITSLATISEVELINILYIDLKWLSPSTGVSGGISQVSDLRNKKIIGVVMC